MMLIRSVIVLLMLSVSAFGELKWTHSYEEAKAKALEENKNVMIMLARQNCDACWYMENIVFEDKKIQKLLQDNFVPVHLDVDKHDIPKDFSFTGTPTFFFTKADGERLGQRLSGASNVKDFTAKVNAVLKELQK